MALTAFRRVRAERMKEMSMELLPGIHRVDGVTSNVYLLVEPDGLTVVDTGMPGSGPKIAAYIRRMGRDPRELRHVLLTHQHLDHVGGAAALAAETSADVLAHPMDAPAIEGKAPRDLPHGPLRPIFRWLLLPRLQPVHVTRQVRAGETLPVLQDDGGLQVIETPGHTLGQIGFYLPGRKLFFAGDAYAHGKDRIVPSYAMFNRDTPLAHRTLADLAQSLEIEVSLCGHGAPILQGAGEKLRAAAPRVGAG